MQENLETFRKQIDEIDKKLIDFLWKRLEIVKKIWEYKKENNIAILQKSRWEEVLKTRKKWAENYNLKGDFIEDIFNRIHKESLDIEK